MGQLVSAGFGIAAAQEKKKGGGVVPQYPKRGLKEKLLDSTSLDVLRQEQALVNDALSMGAVLQPEMFRTLGFEPIYDETASVDLQDASAALRDVEDKQRRRTELKTEIKSIQGQRSRKATARRNELRDALKKIPGGKKLQRAVNKARRLVGELSAVPQRIIGIKPIEGADPTGSAGGAFRQALDLQSDALVRALRGDEPIDPTLRRAFDEKERALREQLRRQFGPDFESADAAREILSNFDRERAEAFAQYNREQISEYSRLSESRAASLSNLATARLGQLQEPVRAAITRAGLAGAFNEDISGVLNRREGRRRSLFEAAAEQFRDRYINNMSKAEGLQQTGDSIGSIVNTVIGAATGGVGNAGTIGSALSTGNGAGGVGVSGLAASLAQSRSPSTATGAVPGTAASYLQ